MKSLQKFINPDAFDETGGLDKDIVNEFYERSMRKREDEAWLKKHNALIKEAMTKLGKNISDVNDKRIVIIEPDTSHFDLDKVMKYLTDLGDADIFDTCTKTVVDEEGLTRMIEGGYIDLENLKEIAWVESKGSSRLTVKKVGE